ncbi:MAG: hypothetical protein ACI4LX_09115 [Treponema sp.]
MKKIFKAIKRLAFAAAVFSAGVLLASCNSTKQEQTQTKNTTFVNTKVSDGNMLYSVMIFSELTEVKASYLKKSEHFEIPLSSCVYESDTTNLTIKLPKEIPYKASDLVFTITGVPLFPAEFILCNAVYKNAAPGVFINGKKAVLNTDYTLDTKTNHLKFITPIDSDKDSYEIMWKTSSGTNSMSNNTSQYQKEYRQLEMQWLTQTGNF